MARKYRSLKSEFREYLTKHDAWPKHEKYLDYMADFHGGIARSSLTHLRNGASALEKAPHGLIEMYCLDANELKPGARTSFIAFLASLGISDPEQMMVDDVLHLLCEPATSNPQGSDEYGDHLFEAFHDPLSLFKLPGRSFVNKSMAADSRMAVKSVEWVYYLVAQTVSDKKSAQNMSLESAITVAEEWMKTRLSDYQQKVLEWNQALPASVRLAMGKEQPVGVSVVLPLKREIYEQVRDGKIESSDCTPEDFEIPSNYLVIECCAERVGKVQSQEGNATLSMFAALSTQLACMANLHENKLGENLHLLSFAGIELGQKRLAKQGFKPTGAKMPRSGAVLMERVVRLDVRMGIDVIAVAILSWISKFGRDDGDDFILRES